MGVHGSWFVVFDYDLVTDWGWGNRMCHWSNPEGYRLLNHMHPLRTITFPISTCLRNNIHILAMIQGTIYTYVFSNLVNSSRDLLMKMLQSIQAIFCQIQGKRYSSSTYVKLSSGGVRIMNTLLHILQLFIYMCIFILLYYALLWFYILHTVHLLIYWSFV